MKTVSYVHLPSEAPLPSVGRAGPFRAVLVLEQAVAHLWQTQVSEWLVESGCLYMMAWGQNCSSWDDSVDHANLEKFDYGDVPEEDFVMTTWHENEALCEVFFFARVCAFHPTIALPVLTILDIREEPRESAILALHEAERCGLLEDVPEDPRSLPLRERFKILLRLQ